MSSVSSQLDAFRAARRLVWVRYTPFQPRSVDEHGFSRVNAVWFRRRRGVTVAVLRALAGPEGPASASGYGRSWSPDALRALADRIEQGHHDG